MRRLTGGASAFCGLPNRVDRPFGSVGYRFAVVGAKPVVRNHARYRPFAAPRRVDVRRAVSGARAQPNQTVAAQRATPPLTAPPILNPPRQPLPRRHPSDFYR